MPARGKLAHHYFAVDKILGTTETYKTDFQGEPKLMIAGRLMCQLTPGGIAEVDQWLGLLRKALDANYARLDKALAAQTRQ
jgi:hypothetical protein